MGIRFATFFFLCMSMARPAWAFTPMPDANLRSWVSLNFPGAIVGTSIDEMNPGVQSATNLSILYQNVTDLLGMEAFTSLNYLNVSGNPITNWMGPASLQVLSATDCSITGTFTVPWMINTLNVSNNQISTLELPGIGNLTYLNCSYNQITSITGLFGVFYSLQTLNCSHNQLSGFSGSLPYYLSQLDMSYNQFTAVPQLNNLMNASVNANHNLITALTASVALGSLDLSWNLVDTVGDLMNSSLAYLNLSHNPIIGGIAGLPFGLNTLTITDTQLPCLPYLNGDLVHLYSTGNSFTCLPNQPVDLVMSATDLGFTPAVCTSSDPCFVPFPSIDLRVFLQGPFDFQTFLMNDDLRAQGLLPTTEPYTALGFTYQGQGWADALDPNIFTGTGPDAIVDWVVVDMFPNPYGIDGNSRRYSRPALLQRDGDVVGLDGSWPLKLYMPHGIYVAAVRHRNHLGAIERFGEWYGADTTLVDFTEWSTTACFGQAMHGDSLFDPNRQLWSGDVTFNHQLKYVGAANDRDPILVAIGGVVPHNTVSGVYANEDVNMDGVIKHAGVRNDRDPILVNIGGNTPNAVRNQAGFQ